MPRSARWSSATSGRRPAGTSRSSSSSSARGSRGDRRPVPPPIPGWFTSTMLAINIVVGGTMVFTLLALFASSAGSAGALREQDKSENLLLNILPRSIADRLKAETQPIADHRRRRRSSSPTSSTSRRGRSSAAGRGRRLPRPSVQPLRRLAERYGVEKIKTIGDCYMVAAGVPTPRTDHARALALLALDMLEDVRSSERGRGPRPRAPGSASIPARWWPA